MRWLKVLTSAVVLAWLAASFAQQGTPPRDAPPADPPRPAAPAPEQEGEQSEAPNAPREPVDDVFIPTEELQPDAAVTFPVDI